MKLLRLIVPALLVIGLASCKRDIARDVPTCIKKQIKSHGPSWPIAKVDEYEFQGKIVYAFEPDGIVMADGSTEIKDESCNTICAVGGFGGPGVALCNGADFYATAVFKRNIWTK